MMNKEIWIRIDTLLRTSRRTWSSLAKALNYSDQRVSNWKRRGVPAQVLTVLSTYLGVSLSWLATGKEENKRQLSESAISFSEKELLLLWRGLTQVQRDHHFKELRITQKQNETLLQELTTIKANQEAALPVQLSTLNHTPSEPKP